MSISKEFCPVPFDQQPLNEFYFLKDSCFFSFFGFRLKKYIYSLISLILILFILLFPLIGLITVYRWFQFCIIQAFLVTFILILVLVRLYLGWSYIANRLFSATIFYEESGWYDGQMWIKTSTMLTKDRLIAVYYVFPLLSRIRYTLIVLVAAIIFEFFLYYLLC